MNEEPGLVMVSNFSFFVPAAVAVVAGYNFFALLIILAMFFSVLYHANRHQPGRSLYLRLDYLFAYLLLVANAYLVLSPFKDNLFFYLAVFTAVLSVRMYFKDGEEYYKHAYWHILASLVTLFSLFSAIY